MTNQTTNTPQNIINDLDVTQISDDQMAQFAVQFNQIEPSIGHETTNIGQIDLYSMLNIVADITLIGLAAAVLILAMPTLRQISSSAMKRFSINALLSRG